MADAACGGMAGETVLGSSLKGGPLWPLQNAFPWLSSALMSVTRARVPGLPNLSVKTTLKSCNGPRRTGGRLWRGFRDGAAN